MRAASEAAAMHIDQFRQAERAADYLARRGGAWDAEYGIEVAKAINARRVDDKARRT